MSSRDAFAAAVSRKLREGGIRPLPSGTPITREGVRVSRSPVADTARVAIDLDAPSASRRMADAVEEILVGAGYAVDRRETTDTDGAVYRSFYVSKCPGGACLCHAPSDRDRYVPEFGPQG